MAKYFSEHILLDMRDKDMNYVYDLTDLEEYLAGIPTADVQEVRHGKWIEDKETGCLMCSKCGHFTDEIIGDFTYADEKIAEILSITKGALIHRSMNPFYCSKCGALMDGKE